MLLCRSEADTDNYNVKNSNVKIGRRKKYLAKKKLAVKSLRRFFCLRQFWKSNVLDFFPLKKRSVLRTETAQRNNQIL